MSLGEGKGNVPEGWQEVKLGDVVIALESGFSVNADDEPVKGNEIGILKLSALSNGNFLPDENKRVKESDRDRLKISAKANCILISRANTFELVGVSAYVPRNFPNLYLPDLIWQMKIKDDVDVKWLNNLLVSREGRLGIQSIAAGSNTSMLKINKSNLLNLSILLPPLPEQQKIAAILSAWDESISTLTKLLAAKQQQKRGLSEELLTGKRRLKGFAGEWEEKKLGDVLLEPQKPVELVPHEIELLTVKLHVKGVERTGKFPAVTKSARPYYRRYQGEILIGRQNFHNGGVGIVGEKESGLICSNAISSYLPIDSDLRFIFYFISREDYYSAVDDLIGGTGQKEISRNEFSKLPILLPPLPEQQAIASILSTLDDEILALTRLKAALQQQKRGLMDVLLTGRVRVSV